MRAVMNLSASPRPIVATHLLLVLVATLLGCGEPTRQPSDLGVADSAQPADLLTCTLVKPYAATEAVCNDCAEARCCAEVNGCYGSASCDEDYVNCYLACGLFAEPDAGGTDVTACVADCDAQHPAGKLQFEAAIGCVEQRCSAECD